MNENELQKWINQQDKFWNMQDKNWMFQANKNNEVDTALTHLKSSQKDLVKYLSKVKSDLFVSSIIVSVSIILIIKELKKQDEKIERLQKELERTKGE